MTTDNRTNEPTAEQIVRATLLRCQFDTLGDKAADVVKDLRTHGLLSEGAPSEQQVERAARAFFREYHGEDIWPEIRDDGELDTRSRALAATRAALTAAGVAPQEPSQTETKSGNNFVSLAPEKVAEVLHAEDSGGVATGAWVNKPYSRVLAHALCEAYTEGKLTK